MSKNRSSKPSAESEMAECLTETFYISSKKNSVFQVKLSADGLCLRKENSGSLKEQIIQIKDILGCRCLRSQRKQRGGGACSSLHRVKETEDDLNDASDSADCSAYLYIYAYVIKKSLNTARKRERTVLTLRFRSFDKFEDNNREAQKWRTQIKCLMQGSALSKQLLVNGEKHLLVILNPKSGKGKARETFQEQVAPIYAEAEIPYDLYVTKRANFAREFVRTRDLHSWRGIVVCGGDGIHYEVINGIMERPDWEEIFENIPIGIIPCGSGNGLAKTISHIYNENDSKPVLNAAIATARGHSALMDLVRVETKSDIMFSFLSVGWGFISDIDIESERLRYMGYQRFTLWSLHRLINLRTYHGKIHYVRANTDSLANAVQKPGLQHSKSYNTYLDKPSNWSDDGDLSADSQLGEVIALETTGSDVEFRPRFDSWYSATSRKSAYYSIADSVYGSIHENSSNTPGNTSDESKIAQLYGPSPQIPSLMSPVPSDWTTEEGDYIMVQAAYQSHLSSDCYFAPSSKLNDGIISLVVIRGGVSRSQLLTFLLGMSSGTHLPTANNKNDLIELIPVTAFRIEPSESDGIMTVDGERVDYGAIQGEIFPGIVRTMVPN